MKLETRADRIRFIREEILKLSTQEELAAILGVQRGAVGNWELDKPIGFKNLIKLAGLANCSADWIATGRGEPPIVDSLRQRYPRDYAQPIDPEKIVLLSHRDDPVRISGGPKRSAGIRKTGRLRTDLIVSNIGKSAFSTGKYKPGVVDRDGSTVDVPERGIKELDSSAGLGGGQTVPVNYEEGREGFEPVDAFKSEPWIFPSSFMQGLKVSEKNVIAVTTQGESMAPTINHGDVVFVDTTHVRVSPPGLYALRDIYGEVIVKRLDVYRKGDAILMRITSDNPHEPSREEPISEIAVVGRVCGIMKLV